MSYGLKKLIRIIAWRTSRMVKWKVLETWNSGHSLLLLLSLLSIHLHRAEHKVVTAITKAKPLVWRCYLVYDS
jgi:hypothetical protein